MLQSFLKTKKKFFIIVFLIAVFDILLIPQGAAQAEGGIAGAVTDWISGKAIGGAAWFANLIIGFFAGIAFSLAGALVNWTIGINASVIGQPVVTIGWNIILQFANLGFVLAIIVIAFATILRLESYGMKKTLGKLVAAALLVNFSLVIAGIPLSVANVITKMFQDKAQLGPVEAATTFANAFKIQKFMAVGKTDEVTTVCDWSTVAAVNEAGVFDTGADTSSSGDCTQSNQGDKSADGGAVCECMTYSPKSEEMFKGISGIGKAMFVGLASILFTTVFTIIAAISLFALAIMLLIRFIYLGILLVLSPIVWLCWIFPNTQEHWKKWWNEFIRWTFFAPAVMFFLYLAVQATKGMGVLTFKSGVDSGLEAALLQSGVTGLVGNMIMIIGFLIGGLFAANHLGITFAKTAYGWAEGAAKGTAYWYGRNFAKAGSALMRPRRWGERAGGRIRGTGESLAQKKGWYNAPTRWLGKKMTVTGGAIERAPSYKAPTLYQSIRKEVYGAAKKEPLDRKKQVRKDISELLKMRKDMEDNKVRAALKAQTDIDLYEKLKKKDEDKLSPDDRTKLEGFNTKIAEAPYAKRIDKQIADIDSELEKLNAKLVG